MKKIKTLWDKTQNRELNQSSKQEQGLDKTSIFKRKSGFKQKSDRDNKRKIDNSVFVPLVRCWYKAWPKIQSFCTPSLRMMLIGIPLAGILLTWAFIAEDRNHPLTYIAYVFSAYMLVAVCFHVARLNPLAGIKRFAYRNVYTGRYVDDRDFRAVAGAYLSLLVDGIWTFANLSLGIYFSSAWYVTLAAYYFFHAVMRAVLVGHIREVVTVEQLRRGYKACRICGVFIGLSAMIISGIVLLVITNEGGFIYVGTMIYAAALYAFWALITSIMNFVTYRTHDNPVLFTVMNVNLVTALVSIFALEIAMLAAFSGEDQYTFQMVMIGASGAVITVIDLSISVFLVFRSTKELSKLS